MSEQAVEKFDQPMEFDQYLGQLDMERHPLWESAWRGQNQDEFETILYDLGADLNYGYDFRVCLHRSRMTSKVECGLRVGFRERSDKWWVDNMMDTSDIVRNTHDSIRATGMRMGLNEDSPLNEVMMDQASKFAMVVDIKCNDSEVK
jgi:hypothetical protein